MRSLGRLSFSGFPIESHFGSRAVGVSQWQIPSYPQQFPVTLVACTNHNNHTKCLVQKEEEETESSFTSGREQTGTYV